MPACTKRVRAPPCVVDMTTDSADEVTEVVQVGSDDDCRVHRMHSTAPPTHFHGYQRGRELGRGASGMVFTCSHSGSAGSFAVKTIDLRRMQLSANPEREHTSLCREVDILRTLPPHRNIVQMIDAFEGDSWFFMVLELVSGGDLFAALTKREPPQFLEREAAFVLQQLADGLVFLHSSGVMHRDLKLENILVDSEYRWRSEVLYTVKITDFGLSKVVGDGISEARSLVGTHPYMAPEVAAGGTYQFSSDLWCLGVLLFVLLSGRFPFDRAPEHQDEVDHVLAAWDGSILAASIVHGLLQLEPAERSSLETLSGHSWFQDGFDDDGLERRAKRQCTAHSTLQMCPPPGGAAPDLAPGADAPLRAAQMHEPAQELIPLGAAEPPRLQLLAPHPRAAAESLEASGASAAARHARVGAAAGDGGAAWLRQLAHRPSDIGEWLALIYSAPHRGGPEAGARGTAVVSAEPGGVTGAAGPQAGVLQVHVAVPLRFAASVLGRCRVHMRQIAATVGCGLQVASRSGFGHQFIIAAGTYSQCVVVQEVIHSRMMDALRAENEETSDQAGVGLMIRAEAADAITGTCEAVLEEKVRQLSGVEIRVLPPEPVMGQRPCVLTGTFAGILRAERDIFHLVHTQSLL